MNRRSASGRPCLSEEKPLLLRDLRRRRLRIGFVLLVSFPGGCEEEPPPDLKMGETKFQMFCSPCHGPEGQGTEGGPPPLARSPWVMGPETRLIRIILHGVRGAIEVHDQTYNLEMLGFGQILKDEDIASILSFVRDRFGETSPPITTRTVRKVRAMYPDRMEYWTVEELKRDA